MKLLYRLIVIMLVACAFPVSEIYARPPKMLDFGFAKYKMSHESLFREPVRQVLIRKADFQPYAIIFENRISFIDESGGVISESPLPDAARVRAGESANNKYVAIYGNLKDSNLGFFRLFDDRGETFLVRDSVAYNDRYPVPLPLEGSQRLVSVSNGALILTDLAGDTLITKTLLVADSFQDGDIILAPANQGDEFSAAVNKYQIPTGREGDWPMLYRFNSEAEILASRRFDFLLVSNIAYTPLGGYVRITGETEDGQSDIVLCQLNQGGDYQAGHFENVTFLRFAEKPGFLLLADKKKKPEMVSAKGWNTVDTIDLPATPLSWIDVAFDADGSYALFYNNDKLVLWDNNGDRLASLPFPYSFRRCFISEGGRRIVLTGDFGFVVYDK